MDNDKKPPALKGGKTDDPSSGVDDYFAYAMENVETDELPGFVRSYHKLLGFPEKLMLMLVHAEKILEKEGKLGRDASIAWNSEGSCFFIRDKDELTSRWLPLFFPEAKYSSFTRKLYRWGFRKLSTTENGRKTGVVAFRHAQFKRDDPKLMSKMQSITAAKARRIASENEKMAATFGSDVEGGGGDNVVSAAVTSVAHTAQLPLPSFAQAAQQPQISFTGLDTSASLYSSIVLNSLLNTSTGMSTPLNPFLSPPPQAAFPARPAQLQPTGLSNEEILLALAARQPSVVQQALALRQPQLSASLVGVENQLQQPNQRPGLGDPQNLSQTPSLLAQLSNQTSSQQDEQHRMSSIVEAILRSGYQQQRQPPPPPPP